MTEPGRRDPSLLVAILTSTALAITVWLAPDAAWRIPLALLGGVWAPGYALLALAYPRGRLSQLERHALAACAGLCLLPILALLASEALVLRPRAMALVALGLTCALAGPALWRAHRAARGSRRLVPRGEGAEPLVRSALPSTRATLALCLGALLVAAIVEAGSTLTSRPEPASLALSAPTGELDLRPARGESATVIVTARAGASPTAGDLVALWDGEEALRERVALSEGASQAFELAVPTATRGERELVVTWLDLRVDATFAVGAG